MEEVRKEAPKLVVATKPKQLRFRVEAVNPSTIVDVWRLYEQSLRLSPDEYPDQSTDDPKTIQSVIYSSLTSPNFLGMIARTGKRPVGHLLADVLVRPIGKPYVYLRVSTLWVDPQFRKQGVATLLVREMGRQAKAKGIHFYEALSQPDRSEMFKKLTQDGFKTVSHVWAGKIPQE